MEVTPAQRSTAKESLAVSKAQNKAMRSDLISKPDSVAKSLSSGKNMSYVGKIHPDDRAIMEEFVAYMKNKGKISKDLGITPDIDKELELSASDIADGLGIPGQKDAATLAKRFQEILKKK